MEIEKKWLFTREQLIRIINDETAIGASFYWQAYLSIHPEVRIRKRVNLVSYDTSPTYGLTIKGDGGLTRPEVNCLLGEDEFEELLQVGNLTLDDFIFKELCMIALDKYILTLCEVHCTPLESFCYGEIEFENEEEANAYVPTFEYLEEVTENPDYKMKNIWRMMREKEKEKENV